MVIVVQFLIFLSVARHPRHRQLDVFYVLSLTQTQGITLFSVCLYSSHTYYMLQLSLQIQCSALLDDGTSCSQLLYFISDD